MKGERGTREQDRLEMRQDKEEAKRETTELKKGKRLKRWTEEVIVSRFGLAIRR